MLQYRLTSFIIRGEFALKEYFFKRSWNLKIKGILIMTHYSLFKV